MLAATIPGTRTRLVQATQELIWERSFQAAGVDEICARANVRKGSFYHYFPSKTDLAIAAIQQSWDEVKKVVLEPIIESNQPGLDQLSAFIKAVDTIQTKTAKTSGSYPGCPFGNLGQEMARQDKRIRKTLDRIYDAHVDAIETMLRRAQADRHISAGNLRPKAKSIFALFEGALLLAKVANDPRVFREVVVPVQAIATA